MENLGGTALRELFQPEPVDGGELLLPLGLRHGFLDDLGSDEVGLHDHHRPLPARPISGDERRHVISPPQPFKGHNCVVAELELVFHLELGRAYSSRSEEHTSELQSRENLVCRLLLEKKKANMNQVLQ